MKSCLQSKDHEIVFLKMQPLRTISWHSELTLLYIFRFLALQVSLQTVTVQLSISLRFTTFDSPQHIPADLHHGREVVASTLSLAKNSTKVQQQKT